MMFASSQPFLPSNGAEETNSLNVPRPESPQRSRFTKEEDHLLKLLVSAQPQPKWSEIAKNFQNRTARQCRERYNNYLRPDLINGPWTKEEDDLLIELFERHGPKWSLISQSFNSRSSVNVKNHHSSLINQLSKTSSCTFKIEMPKKEEPKLFEIKLPVPKVETVVQPVQTYFENDFTFEEEEPSTLLDDDCFQNMLSSFQVEDEMWTTSLPQPEDDLFAF